MSASSSACSSPIYPKEQLIQVIPVEKQHKTQERTSWGDKESVQERSLFTKEYFSQRNKEQSLFSNASSSRTNSKQQSIESMSIFKSDTERHSSKESMQNIHNISSNLSASSSRTNPKQSFEDISSTKRSDTEECASRGSEESFHNIYKTCTSSKESLQKNLREQFIEVIPITKLSDSKGCASQTDKEPFVLRKDTSCDVSSDVENPKSNEEILNQNNSSETESEDEQIVLSAFWRNGKFGAAYFNIITSEIHVLNEISDVVPEHYMLRNFYRQVLPMSVLTDARATRSFVNCLKSLHSENKPINATEESDANKKNNLYFLPKKDYNFETCKYRVYQLSLPNEPAHFSENDHHIFLSSILNFDQKLTIHALGALLIYLDKNWRFLRNDLISELCVLGINILSLDKIVTMNDETYQALHIFNKISHPSSCNKGIARYDKEGISLFSIFNRCCTNVGMQHLRLMLKHPTNDVKVIQRRFDTITFFNTPGNEDIVKSICSCLTYVKNVNGIMTKIKGLTATPFQWQLLFNTLYNAILICEICENFKSHSSLFNALASQNNKGLYSIAHHMHSVIDFELSKTQGRFIVNMGFDPALDKKKRVMMELENFLTSTANLELQKLPDYVGDCIMVYLPNLGYMIGVKVWKSHINEDEKELPNLKFVYDDENFLYYKSKGCEEIDYVIGDKYPEIVAYEMRIMRRLTAFILKYFHVLSSIIKLCAELDCIISIAKVCKDMDYKRPTLTLEKIIDIKQGRHPIQEIFVENFIPNDTLSVYGKQKVTIVTGPNSCGKSVYLKQVAMIVYMAHIGSFVPAESATIGLTNHIYSRVQTTENISMRMSAFLIDLRQISQAIEGASSSSLVIIDEFGKGTNEIDGKGLFIACVNEFLLRKTYCPHVFISTHFNNFTDYIIPSQNLKLLCMDYLLEDKKAVYLYKLIEGTTKKNFAISFARHIGLDPKICNRARNVLKHLYERYPLPDKSLEKYAFQEKIIFRTKQIVDKEEIDQTDINKLLNLISHISI